MKHVRTIDADANGGKSGLAISWPAAKAITAIVSVLFAIFWTLFIFVRSMDQKLIAAQMEKTLTLIKEVEGDNDDAHMVIYDRLVEIKDHQEELHEQFEEDLAEIKEAIRVP